MAGKKPARSFFGNIFPPSPLGATPRPHLRQVYPSPPEGTYVSEYQLNKSVERDYDKVKHTTTKTSYTVLRSQRNGLDKVDAPVDVDYIPPADIGSSTKSILILMLIFFLSLLAIGWFYVGLTPQAKE